MKAEWFSINDRLEELLVPWQQAHVALVAAYQEAQAVLRDVGYKARLDS